MRKLFKQIKLESLPYKASKAKERDTTKNLKDFQKIFDNEG